MLVEKSVLCIDCCSLNSRFKSIFYRIHLLSISVYDLIEQSCFCACDFQAKDKGGSYSLCPHFTCIFSYGTVIIRHPNVCMFI